MIKNLIIIGVIVAIVIFSQQPAFKSVGQNTYSWITKNTSPYTQKATNWATNNLYPIVNKEISQKKELVAQEINSEKAKVSQTLADKIKNYITNAIDSLFNLKKPTQTSSSLLDSVNSQDINTSPETQKCIQSCQVKLP